MKKLIEKSKEFIKYFQNIFFLYKKIGEFDKAYIFFTIVIILVRAIHPFNGILFLQIIVNELTNKPRWTITLLYIALMCLIELILRSLDTILWAYEKKKIVRFKAAFLEEINLKTMSLPYQQIEDPKLIDDRQKALEIFYPGQAHFMDLQNTIVDSKHLISHILRFCGFVAILLTLKPFIFLILLVTYFFSIILNTIASDKEFNVWSNSLVKVGRRIGYFKELSTDYAYAKEMRVNRLGQWIVDKMYGYFISIKSDIAKSVNIFTLIEIISNTLKVLINGVIYFYIGWLAYTSVISISEVIVYMTSLGIFIAALMGVSSCLISLQKAGMHLSIYFNFLKTISSNEPSKADSDFVLDTTRFEIEFVNVSFKYPGQEHYALKNFNIKIIPNEKLAIVGENGAGKTTLIKLLTRFYKPTEGQILINGIDIERISTDNYMKIMTAVFQDFNILNFSLLENISFDSEYDESKITEIMQNLDLVKTVESLPKGLHTELGRLFSQDGIELSGGQQQKLAIARALFKNSHFIILDEPTAMLSPKAEYEIYTNFAELTKDRTTVFISHRMSSCRFCNRIAVMRSGEMVELGDHDQLMQEKGEYYRLFSAQAELYESLAG